MDNLQDMTGVNIENFDNKMLAIDTRDAIVGCFAQGCQAEEIAGWKDLKNWDTNIPVVFRSMAQRKTVNMCENQKRPYFYIDTGYIGNLNKKKHWHRVVPNGMQHSKPRFDLPSDRFDNCIDSQDIRFKGWKKDGGPILLVTPSDKPCLFYGIERESWIENTINEIKKHTDREVIVRNKGLRRDRVRDNSIYHQFEEDNIFAVVTYNSIAATEAIGFGIPCFTLAPNAADFACGTDLSRIENPIYVEEEKVIGWQNWLGYCQYNPQEMVAGTVLPMLREYGIE